MAADSEVTKQFYYAVKSRSSCLICNNPNIQFHHVRPSEKISEVCKIARIGDMGLLVAEFKKVVPVCDEDHRAIHAGKIKGWLEGKTIHGAPSSGYVARKYMPFFSIGGYDDTHKCEDNYYRYRDISNNDIAQNIRA